MTTAGESPQCGTWGTASWQEHLLRHPLQPRARGTGHVSRLTVCACGPALPATAGRSVGAPRVPRCAGGCRAAAAGNVADHRVGVVSAVPRTFLQEMAPAGTQQGAVNAPAPASATTCPGTRGAASLPGAGSARGTRWARAGYGAASTGARFGSWRGRGK